MSINSFFSMCQRFYQCCLEERTKKHTVSSGLKCVVKIKINILTDLVEIELSDGGGVEWVLWDWNHHSRFDAVVVFHHQLHYALVIGVRLFIYYIYIRLVTCFKFDLVLNYENITVF